MIFFCPLLLRLAGCSTSPVVVHAQQHMIRGINTETDAGEPELLHAPIWFARYEHKAKNIVLVIDASSGGVINSIGID